MISIQDTCLFSPQSYEILSAMMGRAKRIIFSCHLEQEAKITSFDISIVSDKGVIANCLGGNVGRSGHEGMVVAALFPDFEKHLLDFVNDFVIKHNIHNKSNFALVFFKEPSGMVFKIEIYCYLENRVTTPLTYRF